MNKRKEPQGSNYFASMTDMLVGILFIFVIMIAFFAFLEKSQKNPLQDIVEGGVKSRVCVVNTMIEELQNSGIDARTEREGVVTISGKGLFASAQSDLKSVLGAVGRVDTIGEILLKQVKSFSITSVVADNSVCNRNGVYVESVFVEGHTDNIPVTSILTDGSTTNLELSARRATNTYQQLDKSSPGLLDVLNPRNQQALSVASYGEQRPIANNALSLGREDNRRIDIRFVMHIPETIADAERLRAPVSP